MERSQSQPCSDPAKKPKKNFSESRLGRREKSDHTHRNGEQLSPSRDEHPTERMGRGGGPENEDAADIKALLLDDKRVKALATKGRSEAMILAHRKVSCERG